MKQIIVLLLAAFVAVFFYVRIPMDTNGKPIEDPQNALREMTNSETLENVNQVNLTPVPQAKTEYRESTAPQEGEAEEETTLPESEIEEVNEDNAGAIQYATEIETTRLSAQTPPTYWIALVNNGSDCEDSCLRALAKSLKAQVNEDIYPVWGVKAEIWWYASVSDWQSKGPGTWPIFITPNCPYPCNYPGWSGPGGGFHWNIGTLPYVHYWYNGGGEKASSHPISHEMLEMIFNPLPANYYKFVQYGKYQYALEVADPVWPRSMGYTKEGLTVSNWTKPGYFQPGAQGPFDYMGFLKKSPLIPACQENDGVPFQAYTTVRAPAWYQYYCN